MKLRITLKDPDALHESIRMAVRTEVSQIQAIKDNERGSIEDDRCDALLEICKEWFQYSEYVKIEIDTEAKTASVLKVRG